MCERKELIDKGLCDKGFIWNPSNCESECYKSCDIEEYLEYDSMLTGYLYFKWMLVLLPQN